jgi:hypothetical protein
METRPGTVLLCTVTHVSSVVEFLAWGTKLACFCRKNECTKGILLYFEN